MTMKIMNISVMKLIIRLIILLIFFVILYMILAILYSTKYWPDIHNYINGKITIKRIPTLSELNLTILEVDGTTEIYTTDDYIEVSTVEGFDINNINDYTDSKDDVKSIRIKRQIPIEDFGNAYPRIKTDIVKDFKSTNEFRDNVNLKNVPPNDRLLINGQGFVRDQRNLAVKDILLNKQFPLFERIENFDNDYSEIPKPYLVVDYSFSEEPTTAYEGVIGTKIIKDLITESKLIPKNFRDVEIIDGMNEISHQKLSDPINATDIPEIYPWITTIFIKNESKNDQFDYFCDGALLSDKTLITAARCVYLNNTVMNADDILVILGKTSLLIMDDKERPVKVKQIIIHDNFTNVNGKIENDLALLIFEEAVDFNEIIQATAIGNDTKDVEKLVTTAWNLKGEIVPVFLDDMENKECNSRNAGKHMFCAKFGQDVALCPSYGGVFAAKEDDSWYIYGIRSGDTADRGLCFDKHLWFTDLRKYDDWITENWE